MSETAVAWRPRQPECQWACGFRRHSGKRQRGRGRAARSHASPPRMIPTDFASPTHPQPAAAALARGHALRALHMHAARPQALGTLPRGCAAGRRSPLRSHRRARQPAIDRRAAVATPLGAPLRQLRLPSGRQCGATHRHVSWPAAAMSGHFGSVQTVLNRTCHGRRLVVTRAAACHRSVPCGVEGCLCNIV